jgi:hypothetical protein
VVLFLKIKNYNYKIILHESLMSQEFGNSPQIISSGFVNEAQLLSQGQKCGPPNPYTLDTPVLNIQIVLKDVLSPNGR